MLAAILSLNLFSFSSDLLLRSRARKMTRIRRTAKKVIKLPIEKSIVPPPRGFINSKPIRTPCQRIDLAMDA